MSLSRVREELRRICGSEHVLVHPHALRTYESDALLHHRVSPGVAVLPASADEVRRVLAACHRGGVAWVVGGSGSGGSGRALRFAARAGSGLSGLARLVD